MTTLRSEPLPDGVFAVTEVLETQVTSVQNCSSIIIVMVDVEIPKFVPVNVVVILPCDVPEFGEMEVIAGAAKDNNFGVVCTFEFPFDAVTLTTKLCPPSPGKVQIIFVGVHDVGVHNILPIFTVFVVDPF